MTKPTNLGRSETSGEHSEWVKIEGGLVTVRIPSEQTTVQSAETFIQITADFTPDERAARAWAANVIHWLTNGGPFNPDRAFYLYGRV